MKTITTKFIATVLNDDYTPAMLQADGDRRNELANMGTNELQTLIDRLADVIPMVNEIRGQKRQEAMKLLEGVVGTGSFASVQELLQAVTGGTTSATEEPRTKAKTKQKTTTNNNRVYRVEIYDNAADERRTYTIVNNVLPPTLQKDPAYMALVAKNPELADPTELLMAYSTEYRDTHPINAKYEKVEFHINERGRLNAKAMKFYEQYKKKNPNATTSEFKTVVMDNYKKV
ncbi:hypothetical protein LD314_004559 [Salmonella enterica]|nr:hypothetical protein [Salmonella enterica]